MAEEKEREYDKNSPVFFSTRVKYITTFAVYYATFSFGCAFTFLSPTVIDFKNKFQSDVQKVSVVFTILTAFYLGGALACGILLRYIRRPYVVLALLLFMCVPLFTIPHLPNLTLFFILSAILGLGAGGYDTVQVAWVIDIWRQKSEPFILGQHFAYSIGTVVPPLLLAPYLTVEEDDIREGCREVTTPHSTTPNLLSTVSPLSGGSDLFIPFTVAAGLVLAAIISQIFLTFKPNCGSSQTDANEKDTKVKESDEDYENKGNSKCRTITLIVLSSCVIASYQGMELTTMQFLPTFSVYSDLCLTQSEGADILFGMTLAFAACRFIGIILVLKIRPHFLLCGNFVLLLAGNIILLFFAQTNLTMLWVASVMMGAGMSTVYGGFYAFIQKHLFVTPTIAAIVAVSGGLVAAIYPLIVGESVENDPSILCYVNFFSIAILVLSFGVTYWFTMIRKNDGEEKKFKLPAHTP